MVLEGNGVTSVMKRDTNLSQTLDVKNSCEIVLDSGVLASMRIRVTKTHVTVWVEDSSDVSFREC
jgi:hypothetical protein